MGSKDKSPFQDALMQFAEALRSKGGIENRAGVLQAERFELFRGKDLVRWVKGHPDKCAPAAAGKSFEGEEMARYLGQQLIRRRLAMHVDRQNKKPLPGTKKLVKFPRKLVTLPPEEANLFVEDGLYVWLYERPTSVWTYVWTALIPLVVLGACLFPLAPNWAKIGVFYLSTGLLVLLLCVLVLRFALAAVTWIVSGHTLWLLPNVMSEELPFSQILKPVLALQHPAEGSSKWANHPLTRLAMGAALGAFLYLLYSHSPDKASITTEATRYKDDLMDWLGVQREGHQRIGAAAVSATDAAANAAEAPQAAAEMAAEAGPEEEGVAEPEPETTSKPEPEAAQENAEL